jgi:hypothetical protein
MIRVSTCFLEGFAAWRVAGVVKAMKVVKQPWLGTAFFRLVACAQVMLFGLILWSHEWALNWCLKLCMLN